MLSRLVITFLPRSKCLFISWLQSPSAVILELRKIKPYSVSIVSPSICHEVMGPDAMTLVFWMLSFKPTFSLSSFTLIKKLFWGPSPGPQQKLLSSRLCHLSPGSYSSLRMLVQEALLTSAHLSAPATTPSSGSLPWPQPTSHTLLSQDSLLAFTFPHRSCHFCNYLAV